MEDRNKAIAWVKGHKKQLIGVGLSVFAIIAAILVADNWEVIIKYFEELIKNDDRVTADVCNSMIAVVDAPKSIENISEKVCSTKIPHDVTEHIRNLPLGQKASAEKIATAADHGFTLLANQTWVETYSTGVKAA